jgi:hypothetical protein
MHFLKYSFSSRARLFALPGGVGGYALTAISRHFFASSVLGGTGADTAEEVGISTATVIMAEPRTMVARYCTVISPGNWCHRPIDV